ncbi:DUF4153 domain-containing protein [Altererythrobacter salegens]|uniref:DUF4153 domain-containing protein n=1 Tax=Croceibacterium salegens TaxID=1737568 RepID=A0A6I4ST03_9SPHN|nr:DUF4153 domain-containing protein [Croceibacterium salegens]MXO58100.1 DUF4153 domain-containing protein [Croceibacterium salegens]
MDGTEGNHIDWPLRPWILAALLGAAGLLVWTFADKGNDVPWRMAATAFVFFGAIAAAFTIERDNWKQPLVFALVVGLVMAGLAWRAVSAGDHYAVPQYGFIAGVISTGLALPLFQSGFHRTRFATPYQAVHYNVWSDALSAGGSMVFVGASWLVLLVLAALFELLKIRFLFDLMDDGWFAWTFSGVAFGAALGILRGQLKILGTLQAVVMTVLSVLAVPLALGLVLFLVAMIVSGPEVLWQATQSATPILLACAAGSWVLANAILRDSDTEMSGNPVLRWASIALAAAILPLTVFAAISLGTRISQHGLSPERIWGLIAIAVACAYGLAWLVALLRGWKGGWGERLRRANLHLAAVICVFAFILALPILDFGRIAAGNQLQRLARGHVSPEDFDYTALRWDFGDAGREALARLAKNKDAKVAELAAAALAQKERAYSGFVGKNKTRADFNLRVQPDDAEIREGVLDYLVTHPYDCEDRCVVLDLGEASGGGRRLALVRGSGYTLMNLKPGTGLEPEELGAIELPTLGPDSVVEVGEGRVIRIDGKVVGPAIGDN